MKTFLSLALVMMLAGPVAAVAQEASSAGLTREHFDQMDTNRDGKLSEAEYRRFMDDAFDKLDTNRDGQLSRDEAANVLGDEQFAAVDANGNKTLSRQEFIDQVTRDFHRQDRDKDGHLAP